MRVRVNFDIILVLLSVCIGDRLLVSLNLVGWSPLSTVDGLPPVHLWLLLIVNLTMIETKNQLILAYETVLKPTSSAKERKDAELVISFLFFIFEYIKSVFFSTVKA